jgi:hypothetical protein
LETCGLAGFGLEILDGVFLPLFEKNIFSGEGDNFGFYFLFC